MKYSVCFLIFLALNASSLVYADTLAPTDIIETSHEIRSQMKRGVLHLDITRVFKNVGKESQELQLGLKLPEGSFVKTLEYNFNGSWTKATLQNSAEAEANYFQPGMRRRKKVSLVQKVRGAALLRQSDPGFSLRIFPLAASGTVKVRYTVETLPKYENRKYTILYPQASDRTRFVDPVFYRSKKEKFNLGYRPDPRCADHELPKDCHILEVNVEKGANAKEISYFSTVLSNKIAGTNYRSDLHRMPQLILDPTGKSIKVENCSATSHRVSCKTPVKMQTGKWRFVFSSWADQADFKMTASFRNDAVERSSTRQFIVGYKKIAFKAKSGPNEVFFALNPRINRTHLEAKIRKPFSRLPKRPRMIFLMDTSWSAGETGIQTQIKLLKSIAGHTNDETLEVITFNRFVNYFTINPKDIDASLVKNANLLKPKNGSDLKAALDKVQVLTRKGSRPTRIYVMSDMKIHNAYAFEKEYVLNLPKNVVLHLVGIEGGREKAIMRRDRMQFSRFASQNRGIGVLLTPSLEEGFDQESLHLVRPTRVETVKVERSKLPDIKEGETYRYDRYVSNGLKTKDNSYIIAGKLWQKDYVLDFKRSKKGDEYFDRRAVLSRSASQKQIRAFGKKHKVVTQYQSLFGVEKKNADGSRPMRKSSGGYGMGASSSYRNFGRFQPRSVRRTTYKSVLAFMSDSVQKVCKLLKKVDERVEIQFWTIDSEIVSVRSLSKGDETDWTRCIHEAVWSTKLPATGRTAIHKLKI